MNCPRCTGLLLTDIVQTTRCINCGFYLFPPFTPDPMRTSCYYGCGNPPVHGKVACAGCATKMREYRAKKKEYVG